MTVFYRSKELVIDNEAIVELLSEQRFALSELSRIHISRRNDEPRRVARQAIVGAVIIVIATGSVLDTSAGWATAVLSVLLLLLGLGGTAHVLRRPRWQLLAVYRGMDVCLCSTTDTHMFGQVRRGLLRALEANRRR
jgi:Na+/H+ antiporter NhaD/arsenite permease-like protein